MSFNHVPFVLLLLPPSLVLPVHIRAAHGGACSFEGHSEASELIRGKLVFLYIYFFNCYCCFFNAPTLIFVQWLWQ